MNFLSNSFKSFFWNVLGAALGFIFQMLAARLLGAEAYGQANYYLGYVSTITIFICFGLQTYLPKYINGTDKKIEMFSEVFWTYSTLFIISDIIIVIILMHSGLNTLQSVLISILAYLTTLSEIILAYNISVGQAALGMFNRKFLYSLLNVGMFIVSYIFISKEYYSYIVIMILSYACTTIYFVVKNIRKPKLKLSIIKSSLGFYIIQLINGVYISYSKVLQKDFGTFETVAVLSISLTLGSLIAMLGDNFAKVSMPLFSKHWEDKDYSKLKQVYTTTTRINCYLVLPIALSLIINSDRILNILGKGYNGGEIIFIFIMISQFINSFTGPNGSMLVMTNHTKFEIFNGLAKLITSILVISIFGNKYVWAVAFSLALSEIIVNILKTIQVKVTVGIYPYDFKMMKYILGLALGESISLFLVASIQNTLLWIVMMGVAIIIIYIITFIFSPNEEDRDIIKQGISKFIKNKKINGKGYCS